MPYMLVRHTVEDYERWKKILDESRAGGHEAPGRRSGGMAFRNVDKPNETLVLVEFESVEQAKEFTRSPELPERRKRAGLVGPPEILFLEKID